MTYKLIPCLVFDFLILAASVSSNLIKWVLCGLIIMSNLFFDKKFCYEYAVFSL